MWKPGANKPSSAHHPNNSNKRAPSPNVQSRPSSMSPKQLSSPPPSTSLVTLDPKKGSLSLSSSKKKKLSGATMGMRFMQRRKSTPEAAKRPRQDQEQIDREKEETEWTTTTSAHENSATNDKNNAKNNKRRRSRISGSAGEAAGESVNQKSNNNTAVQDMDIDTAETLTGDTPRAPVVQIATQSDMYGISATTQTIGRRSFQNFHKSVETSWKKALEMQQQLAADERAERDHITDEELLKRYEKYVKGRGDMVSDSKGRSKRNSVGNLKNKIK